MNICRNVECYNASKPDRRRAGESKLQHSQKEIPSDMNLRWSGRTSRRKFPGQIGQSNQKRYEKLISSGTRRNQKEHFM